MKNSTSLRRFLLAAAFATGFVSLTSCDNNKEVPSVGYTQNAVLISNEGAFTKSNASVSYYNRSTGTTENNIFGKANGSLVLGDVLQHIAAHNDRAYLVMNNSGKVVVVNANTFVTEGEIANLEMPRYFAVLNDTKGYVTEWVGYSGNGRVAVVDLATLTVTKTIEVGVNPEQLLLANGKLYVANIGGNTVSVINTATDALETSIPVTHGPNSLVLDRNNQLWVTAGGKKVYNSETWELVEAQSTPGALLKIDAATNTVSNAIAFSSKAASPSRLTTNGAKDKLFYTYGGSVYQQDINAAVLNPTALINRGFSSLGIDPDNGYIYAGVTPNYTTDGWVIRFNPTGAAVDSFRVGIAPNGFTFR